MGFIRAGFTGGFLGIIISITHIFVESRFIDRLSSVGLYLANFFGKACLDDCGIIETFSTILATIVGNTIAYFVIFAIISMAIGIIKMWLKPSSSVQSVMVQQTNPTTQTPQPVIVQQPSSEKKEQEKKLTKDKRPRKKAKVRRN